MKTKARISYKRQTILILLLFIVPFLICLLSYNIYTADIVVNSNILQENKNRMGILSSSINETLKNIDIFMSSTVANDSDFKVLGYQVGYLNAYLSSYNILGKCKNVLSMHDIATGFFLYSPQNNLFRNATNKNASIRNYRKTLDELQLLIESSDSTIHKWFIHSFGGENYLIRIFEYNNAYLTCIINLNHAAELSNPQSPTNDSLLILATSDMQMLTTNSLLANGEGGISFKKSNEPYYITEGKKRFLVLESYSDFSGLMMVYLVSHRDTWGNMDIIQMSLLFTSILCILLVPVGYYMLKRSFFSPFKGFINTMSSIKQGNFEVSMSNQSPILEFEQMRNTFNEMLYEIKSLKIIAYEQTLEAQLATMQFLRIQIRPHFYLNCLNNLYALAQNGNYKQIQEMILVLSDYLRHMFQKSTHFVLMAAEIKNVESYIALQQMTNSSLLCFSVDIDNGLKDFPIPPLMILTFIENSIKFGICPDKPLIIHVKARRLENDDKDYINVTIIDNGMGFSEEALKSLNSDQIIEDSQHVGIANVKRRFSLQYKGKGIIFFSNSNGACVEIFIPC